MNAVKSTLVPEGSNSIVGMKMKPTTTLLVVFYLNVLIALGICIWYGIDECWDFWEWVLGYFVAAISGTIGGTISGFITKVTYKIKYRKQK